MYGPGTRYNDYRRQYASYQYGGGDDNRNNNLNQIRCVHRKYIILNHFISLYFLFYTLFHLLLFFLSELPEQARYRGRPQGDDGSSPSSEPSCSVSEWGEWSDCSSICDAGSK